MTSTTQYWLSKSTLISVGLQLELGCLNWADIEDHVTLSTNSFRTSKAFLLFLILAYLKTL